MIANERQYRITRSLADRFQRQIEGARASGPEQGVHPEIHDAMIEGLRSQLRSLHVELAEYERLREGVGALDVKSFAEVPTALIKMRIGRNWTQAELARRMNLPEQQIQRYEAELYKGVAWDRIAEVAKVLGVRLEATIALASSRQLDPAAISVWRRAGVALLLEEVQRQHGKAIHGRMELQKLLVLWSDVLTAELGAPVFAHAAWDYGAFDEEVIRDVEFLEASGLLELGGDRPEGKAQGEVLRRALRHVRAEPKDERYEMTRTGLQWLREFLASDAFGDPKQKQKLVALARGIAEKYGRLPIDRLIEETYERFPQLTERSRIKEKVTARIRKRVRK